jgi:hypothetical protein
MNLSRLVYILLIFIIAEGCKKEENPPNPLTNRIEPTIRAYFASYDKGSKWEYANVNDETDITALNIEDIYVRWDTVGKNQAGGCEYPTCKYQERSVAYALKFSPEFTLNINVFHPFNAEPFATFMDPTSYVINQTLTVKQNNKLDFKYGGQSAGFLQNQTVRIKGDVYTDVMVFSQTATDWGGVYMFWWAKERGILQYRLPDGKFYQMTGSNIVKR